MSDSIAKLAVIITGDANPLAAAMDKASTKVSSWARGMAVMKGQNDPLAAVMDRLKKQMKGADNPFASLEVGARRAARAIESVQRPTANLSRLLSVMKGNLSAGFAVGGGVGLALTAMIFGVRSLARAADSLHQSLDVPKLQTWSGQWERVAGVLGGPLAIAARDATEQIANLMSALMPGNAAAFAQLQAAKDAKDAITKADEAARAKEAAAAKKVDDLARKLLSIDKERITVAGKQAKALDDLHAKTRKLYDAAVKHRDLGRSPDSLIAEQDRKREQAAKAAATAAERERDAISDWMKEQTDRVKDIKKDARNPLEQFIEDTKDIRKLFAEGFIDASTMRLSFDRSLEELQEKASDKADKAKREFDQFFEAKKKKDIHPAAERFTQKGLEAMVEGRLKRDAKAEFEKKQTEQNTRRNTLLQNILDAIKNNKPITLKEGDL